MEMGVSWSPRVLRVSQGAGAGHSPGCGTSSLSVLGWELPLPGAELLTMNCPHQPWEKLEQNQICVF